jgi:hypothetical protein
MKIIPDRNYFLHFSKSHGASGISDNEVVITVEASERINANEKQFFQGPCHIKVMRSYGLQCGGIQYEKQIIQDGNIMFSYSSQKVDAAESFGELITVVSNIFQHFLRSREVLAGFACLQRKCHTTRELGDSLSPKLKNQVCKCVLFSTILNYVVTELNDTQLHHYRHPMSKLPPPDSPNVSTHGQGQPLKDLDPDDPSKNIFYLVCAVVYYAHNFVFKNLRCPYLLPRHFIRRPETLCCAPPSSHCVVSSDAQPPCRCLLLFSCRVFPCPIAFCCSPPPLVVFSATHLLLYLMVKFKG